MNRLSKVENHTEAVIIGCGLMLLGVVFVFAGAQSLQVIFGVICAMILTSLMTAFLCLCFDVTWDSDEGIAISSLSLLFSAPFVQYALKFSDNFGVPVISGLSVLTLAQLMMNIFKVSDEPPYHTKTVTEAICFVIGFIVGMKLKLYIAILTTSFFGSFICTMAGAILFDAIP